MEAKLKQNLAVTAFGIILFAALFHFSEVIRFMGSIFHLLLPIIAGGILAIFISVPVNGIEKRLMIRFKKAKKKPTQLIPEIVRSSQSTEYSGVKYNMLVSQ